MPALFRTTFGLPGSPRPERGDRPGNCSLLRLEVWWQCLITGFRIGNLKLHLIAAGLAVHFDATNAQYVAVRKPRRTGDRFAVDFDGLSSTGGLHESTVAEHPDQRNGG